MPFPAPLAGSCGGCFPAPLALPERWGAPTDVAGEPDFPGAWDPDLCLFPACEAVRREGRKSAAGVWPAAPRPPSDSSRRMGRPRELEKVVASIPSVDEDGAWRRRSLYWDARAPEACEASPPAPAPPGTGVRGDLEVGEAAPPVPPEPEAAEEPQACEAALKLILRAPCQKPPFFRVILLPLFEDMVR